MSSTISVVVPFRDAEKYIARCIEALLSQRYPEDAYDILMIDNNSTDRSAEIVRRYPQIRLLSEPKRGSYVARNRGVAESTGAIIAFTDADCVPCADWVERIAEAMSMPGIDIVLGRQRFASERWDLSLLSDYEAEKAAYTFSGRAPDTYYAYSGNMAVRRTLFDEIGPFVELQRGADVVLVQRALGLRSSAVLRYEPGMRITHLEVTSSSQWFHKMFLYGCSFRRYSRIVQTRALNTRERLDVLEATIRHGDYSLTRSVLLIALLSAGVFSYECGRRYPFGLG